MSLLQGTETMRLVKFGPGLRERLERRIAGLHHKAVVDRLRHFREELEHQMEPEPWTALEAPIVLILSDVCGTLGLSKQERARVLGCAGVLVLTDTLETQVRPIPSPRLPMNERQARALAYAREHGILDMSTYRKLCPHWSDETLRLDLANLVKRKLLVKNGAKRGTRYTRAGEVTAG